MAPWIGAYDDQFEGRLHPVKISASIWSYKARELICSSRVDDREAVYERSGWDRNIYLRLQDRCLGM
jgi:hypothetical protein